nr:MAG TPA: hypothetical protein [Caudoviricetes sp.]
MKYIIIDIKKGDIFTEEFDSKEEALKWSDVEWNKLSKYDQSQREAFYVLETINPDEEAENHFDGNIIKEYK